MPNEPQNFGQNLGISQLCIDIRRARCLSVELLQNLCSEVLNALTGGDANQRSNRDKDVSAAGPSPPGIVDRTGQPGRCAWGMEF
jgi:hypothetical protein